MAKQTVCDPEGRTWTIREVWAPPIRGLPPNAWADDSLCGSWSMVVELPLALIGLLISLLMWLLEFPLALLRLSFSPPLIEAEREGEPHVKMTWKARSRQNGPEVIERIAQAIRDDRLRGTDVEGASFVRFD
ncbi:MAG TPA: hypothetical protein VJ838_04590 [Gaiellaceae bacterium]|nr:hypothetical protein [Gaiellaceae bacterium]